MSIDWRKPINPADYGRPMGFRAPMLPMPGVGMQHMPTPEWGNAGGGNWLTGGLKKAGNWLTQDDNLIDVASLGLGAYGAYKQGKQQDEQIKEERRRRDEEMAGKRNAATALSPLIRLIMEQATAGR